MANFDGYVEQKEAVLDSFGGLDRSGALCGGSGCFELRNFRPMADGSLCRREGYRPLAHFEGEVRGVFSAERDGVRECYVVAGTEIFALSEDGEPRVIGALTTAQGDVSFVCLGGAVLLLDGEGIYTLTPDAAAATIPYIPLYGKGWPPEALDTGRDVYEAPSLLTNRIRVSFTMPAQTVYITLSDLAPVSIDAITIDGVLYEGWWEYDATSGRFRIQRAYPEGTRIDLVMTMPTSFFGEHPSPYGAARTAVIGNAEDGRLVLFGGTVPSGSFYMTHATEQGERAIVRAAFAEACAELYLTVQDLVTPGDGIHAVTGACRHYDRSLIFTARGTWMLDGEEGGRPHFIPVNTVLGCTSAGAYCVMGNSPMTVFGRRVLRWSSKTDERDECNASAISTAVEPLLAEEMGQVGALFIDAVRREVWLYLPSVAGRVFVYAEESGRWTSFDGFSPRGMFALGERVGFYAGSAVYLFDETADCDTDEDGTTHPIKAEYLSQYLDFGQAGRTKRLCGATVVATCGKGGVTLLLHDVRGRHIGLPLPGNDGEVSVMQARVRCGRFRYLRVGLRSEQSGALRLHGMRLAVRS